MLPHTLRESLPNGPAFEMVLVEGGRFWRGEGNERHEVQLDDFYLGRTTTLIRVLNPYEG
jgi:hypothetical protein